MRQSLAMLLAAFACTSGLRIPSAPSMACRRSVLRAALAVGFPSAAVAKFNPVDTYSAAPQLPSAPPALPMRPDNLAESKLRQVLAKAVADQEKTLGFALDENDIAELEDILRNKYCGKSGLYSNMEGGSCADAKPAPAYCSDTTWRSSMDSLGTEACRDKEAELEKRRAAARARDTGPGFSLPSFGF